MNISEKDYMVTFRVMGEQTVVVRNCKSKKEAIEKALHPAEIELGDFTVLDFIKSSFVAEEIG